jgi:nucleoside-diphosphate-sugar epimerase
MSRCVLRAAREPGVRRVVVTSSYGAIYYDHPPQGAPFDESTWTNIDGEMSAYVRSKAIAERAAWECIRSEGGALELTAINPTGIFGPVLGPDGSSSVELITRLLNRMPGCPRLFFGIVDVRDIAALHVRAMTHPTANGKRFIAAAGDLLSMLDVARVLTDHPGDAARKVPTRQLPNWVVKLASRFDRKLKPLVPLIDSTRRATSEKARRVLDWQPRRPEEATVATARSLLAFGVISEPRH